MEIKAVIKLQSLYRGYRLRRIYGKHKIKDSFTKNILIQMIDKFNDLHTFYNSLNTKLNNKKLRLPQYPSEITENLVKFVIIKKYNSIPSWDTKKGDLYLDGKQLEVKGSSDLLNGGPSSFGPTEKWDCIYFVDAIDRKYKKFKIYEIKLSNNNEIWKNIKVNRKNTYEEQCLQGRRPRIKFKNLIKQIPNTFIKIIFNGYIDNL
tara:strand:- start:6050 stop:6664 length:615 start_codon:yes stop_codon:yes gene_type:complete